MGMEFRPYYLSREWIKMGYHVDIIAADYSHLRVVNPVTHSDFQKETITGIDYHWVHTVRYKGNGIKRAVTLVQFVGKLLFKAKEIAERLKPDVIITSSTYPLDTYVGQRIKNFCPKAKLIHEIHDMWPAVLTEVNGMSKNNPFVIAMQCAENSFCKHSDYVVSLTTGTRNYLIEHGMEPDKFITVTNGVNLEEWESAEDLNQKTEAVLRNLREEKKFIICFFGSITNYYALPELIKAVQKLNNPDIVVVFIGEGNFKSELQNLAKMKNEKQFIFLGKIPKKEVPSMLKLVDVLYVGGVKNAVFKYGIAMNKLFDSMMSGKPILYAVDAPNNYIKDYDCGISVEPGSIGDLASGILELALMTPEERKKIGDNGRKATLKYFTYPKLAQKFASIFSDCN